MQTRLFESPCLELAQYLMECNAKTSKNKIGPSSDIDMLLFRESDFRGRLIVIGQKICLKANSNCLEDFDGEKQSTYGFLLDVVNL